MKRMRKILTFILSMAMTATAFAGLTSCKKNSIKNVILLIGDGMGPNQIRMGELYKKDKLSFQTMSLATKVETRSYDNEITDSAAAATALATGTRTSNGKVGINADGEVLQTLVDIAKENGKSTGVLTTEEIYGATPMGFSGHSTSRNNSTELVRSAAENSNVNLFASYTIHNMYKDTFERNGYQEIADADLISESSAEKIFGCYNILAEAPSMSSTETELAFDRLVTEAIEYLSKDEDGFFLIAEGAHIDHGGHNNDMMYMLRELMAFDDAVQAVLDWAKSRDDTLVIVTADHETGGLKLKDGITSENMLQQSDNATYEYFTWTSTGHSSADVWCFVEGLDVDFSKYSFKSEDRIKNTDIFQIIKENL
ncbi:MAG: alkaline phosphatase [Clostridiales bacterium]|nr:alkaline phosphatase [Clostridiales bacterium]